MLGWVPTGEQCERKLSRHGVRSQPNEFGSEGAASGNTPPEELRGRHQSRDLLRRRHDHRTRNLNHTLLFFVRQFRQRCVARGPCAAQHRQRRAVLIVRAQKLLHEIRAVRSQP